MVGFPLPRPARLSGACCWALPFAFIVLLGQEHCCRVLLGLVDELHNEYEHCVIYIIRKNHFLGAVRRLFVEAALCFVVGPGMAR